MNLEAQFLWWCSLWIFNGVTELMAHEKKHGFPFLIYYLFNEQYFLMQSPSERKIRLSGYGVELAVKKTEYKAVDDSKVQDDTEGKVQKTDEADDDEVEGFLFGKLRFV